MTTLPLGSETCDTWGRRLPKKEHYLGMAKLCFMAWKVREAFRVKMKSVGRGLQITNHTFH